MAEVYPSDSQLLNILTDSETGVEYIETGKAPYYLEFRKMLYRLILAAKRANDLRVFDEGGLDIGVKNGKFFVENTLVEYAGSSGNTLADDMENIYIYLDQSGLLVIDEYEGFPDMRQQKHIRLAVIETSGGDIVSINDLRGCQCFSVPFASGGVKKEITNHIENCTLSEYQSGSVHTNYGATTEITITLPASATAGTQFTFAVQQNQQLRIEPGSSAIKDDCGQTAGKYKYANAIGEVISLVADQNGDWLTIAKNGTWTQEA